MSCKNSVFIESRHSSVTPHSRNGISSNQFLSAHVPVAAARMPARTTIRAGFYLSAFF